MFRHPHGHGERRHAHGGFGHGGGRFGGHRGGGRGGRVARVFDHGDLRYVLLHLIAEKPRYGYELIKAIEEQVGGMYSPSPGVIYPTLTLLEELGYLRPETAEGTRKLYSITGGRRRVSRRQSRAGRRDPRPHGRNQPEPTPAGRRPRSAARCTIWSRRCRSGSARVRSMRLKCAQSPKRSTASPAKSNAASELTVPIPVVESCFVIACAIAILLMLLVP